MKEADQRRRDPQSGRAKIGYVAAYPYAEVISGYTAAFLLGVRSVVPDAESDDSALYQ
ncbi:MAG: hypothetical protein ACLVCH_12920 [Roseburia inulinivorans]